MIRRSLAASWLLVFCLSMTLVSAQEKEKTSVSGALVRLLQSKGLLTEAEAASISQTGSTADVDVRLARLLLSKGLISQAEYDSMTASTAEPPLQAQPTMVASTSLAGVTFPPGPREAAAQVPATPLAKQAAPPAAPAVISAVAPIRALGLVGDAGFKRDGLAPIIRIGSDVKIRPYGIFKASYINDSSSPYGNDMPLPGFISDSGPGNSAETHITARSFRLGFDFEWLDPSKNVTVTGKVETDFEGNFSRANNRNISTLRSPALQMRLAWVRIDKKVSDKTGFFTLFGQDWTAFGSSTLPPILENTGLGLGYGILYERAPQLRFGVGHELGGSRHWKIEPEFALVLPAYGNNPVDLGNQLGYGERQGADANKPEVQGRIVLQWQLDPAPAVAPAQLIVSGTWGQRKAIVPAANVPTAFKTAFPHGAEVTSDRNGFAVEGQLPTRFFTLLLKGFSGSDLRWYFVGNLFSNFNDTYGLTGVVTGASLDGSSNVAFGLNASGAAVVAPQLPVRARGGFVDLAFPLSRIFNADANGRNAGWTFNMHYSLDNAVARDIRHIGAAGTRSKDDIFAGTLTYKLNKYFSTIFEESYYRTRAPSHTGTLPLFRGIPSYQWHDVRSQLSFVTTF